MPPQYKLIYFDVRGRAEAIRYLLAYSGFDYEDFRVSRDKWPEIKSTMPMGQIPVLEHAGKKLCQSKSIERYLARKCGLIPNDEWDAARVDMLVDGVADYMPHVKKLITGITSVEDPERKKEALDSFNKTILTPFLDKYEEVLLQNGTGHFVGEKLTWIDVMVAELLDRYMTTLSAPWILDSHTTLKSLTKLVHEIPAIKKYVSIRPNNPF